MVKNLQKYGVWRLQTQILSLFYLSILEFFSPEFQSDGPMGPVDEVGFLKAEEEEFRFITTNVDSLHYYLSCWDMQSWVRVSQSKRSQCRPRFNWKKKEKKKEGNYSPAFTRYSKTATLLLCAEQQTLVFFYYSCVSVGGVKWRRALQPHASVWKAAVANLPNPQDYSGIWAYTLGGQYNFCSVRKKGVDKAARVYVLCPWDKCCYTWGPALQPSKHAWEVLDHPGDNLNRNFQAHSKLFPSDMKQRLKIAAAFLAAARHFIALGFWTLGLGKLSANITFPHLPTARKSFFLIYPLSAQFL